MSQSSNTSQKDVTLPSYSQLESQEVEEPKSSSQKSHDSGLSQEHGEMSPNQAVLTEAYKNQEPSQQRSQVTTESSQHESQASSVPTALLSQQGLVSNAAEHAEAVAEGCTKPGSQTTSQPFTEKASQ